MQDWKSSPRFPALYRAIGKMNLPAISSRPSAASPLGFDVEDEEVAPATAGAAQVEDAKPMNRSRPVVGDAPAMDWVLAEEMKDSEERRLKRLSRLRAERELVSQREQIIQRVSRLRQAMVEDQVRRTKFEVMAMEERLRSGYTGRLGWMQAQAARRPIVGH